MMRITYDKYYIVSRIVRVITSGGSCTDTRHGTHFTTRGNADFFFPVIELVRRVPNSPPSF